MISKSSEEGIPQNPSPVYIVSPGSQRYQITLMDLWDVVMRRKWVPLLCILLSVALFVLYIVLVERVYRVESHFLPPTQQDIQGLLIDISLNDGERIKSYTPVEVYTEFVRNLKSLGLRREYFMNNDLMDHYLKDTSGSESDIERIIDKRFNKAIRINVDKNDPSFVTISLDASNPELAAQWLNEYVEFVDKRTIEQLSIDVTAPITADIEKIQFHMESKLKLAKQKRSDTIMALEEALRMATALGINNLNNFPIVSGQAQTGLAVNTADIPPFMRGVGALKAEINVLETRKSDESFIPRFRDLQERLDYLKWISIDVDELSAVTIDMPAKIPNRAQSPRVLGLLVLAIVLGGILGVVAMFLTEFIKASRRNSQAA